MRPGRVNVQIIFAQKNALKSGSLYIDEVQTIINIKKNPIRVRV